MRQLIKVQYFHISKDNRYSDSTNWTAVTEQEQGIQPQTRLFKSQLCSSAAVLSGKHSLHLNISQFPNLQNRNNYSTYGIELWQGVNRPCVESPPWEPRILSQHRHLLQLGCLLLLPGPYNALFFFPNNNPRLLWEQRSSPSNEVTAEDTVPTTESSQSSRIDWPMAAGAKQQLQPSRCF